MKKLQPQRKSAFTLIEALVVLAIIAFLVALLLPSLASRGGKSSQANCISNMKQIALAWLSWVHDHEYGNFPFRTPVANQGTFVPAGAAMPATPADFDALRNTAWWQYAFISNELSSPGVLLCPADKNGRPRRTAAGNFSADPSSAGLMAPGYRNQSCSFTIGVNANGIGGSAMATFEKAPRQILGTDRNIRFDARTVGCSSGLRLVEQINGHGPGTNDAPPSVIWTNSIHLNRGDVLTVDGSVQNTSSRELTALAEHAEDNGSLHFLVPY